MKMEQTECSETLEFKLQTPRNNPEESIRHSKHGESLKSRKNITSIPSLVASYENDLLSASRVDGMQMPQVAGGLLILFYFSILS
jgi:hypothetical protein